MPECRMNLNAIKAPKKTILIPNVMEKTVIGISKGGKIYPG